MLVSVRKNKKGLKCHRYERVRKTRYHEKVAIIFLKKVLTKCYQCDINIMCKKKERGRGIYNRGQGGSNVFNWKVDFVDGGRRCY